MPVIVPPPLVQLGPAWWVPTCVQAASYRFALGVATQLYVAPPASRLTRPLKELKAFTKVRLAPGESTMLELTLDERSFAYWDPGQPDAAWVAGHNVFSFPPSPAVDPAGDARETPGWQVDQGTYHVLVGWSSTDIQARIPVEVSAG